MSENESPGPELPRSRGGDASRAAASPTRRAYLVMLTVSIVLAGLTLAPMWEPLLVGAVLAGVTYPAYEWLDGRVRGHHYVAAALMAIAVAVLILFPFSFLGAVIVGQGIRAAGFISDALSQGGIAELVGRLPAQLQSVLGDLAQSLHLSDEAIAQGAAAGGMGVAQIGAGLVAAAASALVSLGFMMIAYVVFLVDGPRFVRWVEGVSPMEETHTEELLERFRKASAAVLGSALVGIVTQGVVAAIGYTIAGVPSVIFFAALTAFASLIPMIGTQLISLPLAAALLLGGDTWQGVFLIVWGLVAGTVVDNAVRPLVVKTGMQMSGAVVFFALLGGLSMFGLIGAILGPLAITFFMAMIRMSRDVAGGGRLEQQPRGA